MQEESRRSVSTDSFGIARINAGARLNGLSYSKFMYGLKLAGVELNRKVLADMAVNDAQGLASLVELAKSKLLNYIAQYEIGTV